MNELFEAIEAMQELCNGTSCNKCKRYAQCHIGAAITEPVEDDVRVMHTIAAVLSDYEQDKIDEVVDVMCLGGSPSCWQTDEHTKNQVRTILEG